MDNNKGKIDFNSLSYNNYQIDPVIPALIELLLALHKECPDDERESETWKAMDYNLYGMLYMHISEDEPSGEEYNTLHILNGMALFEEATIEVISIILSNWESWEMEELKSLIKANY